MYIYCKDSVVFVFLILLSLIFSGCQTMEVKEPQPTIHWRSLVAGKKEASAKNMPVLVDFHFGEGCPRCMVLVDKVYGDKQIADKINETFIPVRIDLTRELTAEEEELEKVLEAGGECMLAFLDAKGRIVKSQTGGNICSAGMLSSAQFLEYLEQAIANIEREKEEADRP